MPEKIKEGWISVPAEEGPEPTFWPAGLALGSVLLLWGLVTSIILLIAGLALLLVSLGGWLGELRRG